MTLIDLYKDILATGLMSADDEGFISRPKAINPGGTKEIEPVLIDGKRLVLPTTDQLMHADPERKVIFHPLNENALHGESRIVSKLRTAIAVNLNMATFGLISGLISLGISKADHEKLSPDQSSVLSILKNVDEKSLTDMTKIILNAAKVNDMDGLIFKIYLKRGGSVLGKKYSRVGVVTASLYEELSKDSEEFYGVKLRKKDQGVLTTLFEFIFPSISEPHSYDQGSDSDIAPYLDALMQTAASIGVEINDALEKYAEFIPHADEMKIPLAWRSEFENLPKYMPQIRRIPVDDANTGSAKTQEQMQAQANIAANVDFVNKANEPQPQAQPSPAVHNPPVVAAPAATMPMVTPSVMPQFQNAPSFGQSQPSGKVSIDSILGMQPVGYGQMNMGFGSVPINNNSIL